MLNSLFGLTSKHQSSVLLVICECNPLRGYTTGQYCGEGFYGITFSWFCGFWYPNGIRNAIFYIVRTPDWLTHHGPDSKVHEASMGPTWVLSASGGPHVGPMNLGIRYGLGNSSVSQIPVCIAVSGSGIIRSKIQNTSSQRSLVTWQTVAVNEQNDDWPASVSLVSVQSVIGWLKDEVARHWSHVVCEVLW